MIREINDEDSSTLEFIDPEWSGEQFEDTLGIAGATGLLDESNDNFVIGVQVEDELFITRMLLLGNDDTKADLLCEIKRRWKRIHCDIEVEPNTKGPPGFQDPTGLMSQFVDAGWEVGCAGMMKLRFTLDTHHR